MAGMIAAKSLNEWVCRGFKIKKMYLMEKISLLKRYQGKQQKNKGD